MSNSWLSMCLNRTRFHRHSHLVFIFLVTGKVEKSSVAGIQKKDPVPFYLFTYFFFNLNPWA